MSSSFTVNKEKRPRTPKDTNNSFVKNVTSRMSGLLPSSLTKWFSSPSASRSNGSAPLAESTDSSTEDEAVESPVTAQPPAKRMRYSSPGPSHAYIAPEMKCMSTNTEPIETVGEIQSPITRNTFRPETNFVSTPLHSHSEETPSAINKDVTYHMDNSITSENNSVIRKRKSLFNTNHEEKSYGRNPFSKIKKPYFNANAYTATPFYAAQTTYSGVSSSYINQPNVKNRTNTLVTNSSSSSNNDNTISHSAQRVLDLLENYSSPLIEAKRISQLLKSSTSSCLNSSDQDCSIANNSKSLSYKRKELHVPSIATILRIKQRSRLMDTTSAARQIIASHSSSSDAISYPMPETSRSSIPKGTGEKFTTKIKSRLTRINRDDKTYCANDEPVNLPTAVLQIDKNNLPKFSLGTPLSKPSNPVTVSAADTSTKTFTTTSTATQKLIQIDSSKSTKMTVSVPGKQTSKNAYQFSSPVTVSNETVSSSSHHSEFTFGSPEREVEKFSEKYSNNVSSDVNSQVVPEIKETLPEKWKCNDCWVSNNYDAKNCVCCGGKKPEMKVPEVKETILEKWKCNDCWVTNNHDAKTCVCCGGKKPEKKVPEAKESAPEKWKCNDCWVSNNHDAKSCVCCGGNKPGKEKFNVNTCSECKIVLSSGSTSKCDNCQKKNVDNAKHFPAAPTKCKCQNVDKCTCLGSNKPVSSTASADADWKCDICWIKNKSIDEKCAACGAANPMPKSSGTKTDSKTDSQPKNSTTDAMLKNIVKSQSDKWECPNCLVRNENNVSKCVCCDTEKPGTIKEPAKKNFNFGDVPNTTFKFGIDPKQSKVEDKPESVSKVLATPETNNNTLPTTFTFGLPKKGTNENSDKEKADKVESPKPAFTFGIPKQTSTEPASKGGFSLPNFGVSKLPDETSKTLPEKKEITFKAGQPVVSQADQAQATLSVAPQTSSLFSAPAPSQAITNTEQTFKTPLPVNSPSSNPLKIEPQNNNLLLTPKATTATEAATTQATFMFSSSGIKPAANLFSPQVTSTSTTSSSFSPIQASPATPSMSLFQKSNSVSTSPLTFFQKSEPVQSNMSLFNNKSQTTESTAASLPVVSSTPLFSFGGNSTQNATQPEKSTFNFTFGSIKKSETPTLFKPTFGSTTDSSNIGANTNAFGLTNQNNMSSGNMLSGNTLGGMTNNNMQSNMSSNLLAGANNGLPTGNTLDSGNIIGRMGLPNSMNAGANMPLANSSSAIPASGNLFGSPIKKDNMWSPSTNTSSNMFVSNTSNNNAQKPPSFSFGSSSPFNANKGTPTFGSQPQPQSQPQPAQNMFGISSPNSQPSLFSNQMQSPAAPNIFGSQPAPSNPAAPVGMFGNTNVGATPTFGSPNPLNAFEATMNPTPAPASAPAFNFGAQQQSPAVFGFGQQQQQQPSQPGGVYNFGAQPVGMAPAQVQFNMGSAPNISGRRVRKAIRRTTIR